MPSILRRSLLTGSCAVGLALAFVLPHWSLIGLVALVPLFYVLEKSEKLGLKQFLWQCYLFGLVFFGIVMAFMYSARATELIANSVLANGFKALTFLFVMSSLALGFLLAGWLYRRLRISPTNSSILLAPAIWAVGEYARSYLFSVLFIGPGGSIGPYWNFGSLALTVARTPLAYCSRLVGMFGLSLLVVFIAAAVYQIVRKRYAYGWLLLVPLVLSLAGFGLYHSSNGQSIRVQAVALGTDEDTGYQNALKAQLATSPPAQLTALPEYSYYFADSDGNPIHDTMPASAGLIVDSRSGSAAKAHRNTGTYYLPSGKIVAEREKNFLIPGGEYVPYTYAALLVLSGNKLILSQVKSQHEVAAATAKQRPFVYQGVSYGGLTCSGAIAPNLYNSMSQQGAELLINSASISILGISNLYYREATQMSAFIATSNARPYVQAARGGPSYILNKDGHVVQVVNNPGRFSLLSAQIATNRTRTIYSQFGEFVVGLSSLALAIRTIRLIRPPKSDKTRPQLRKRK